MIKLYTDGSCYPNPGLGAWAYILKKNNVVIKRFGAVEDSTNNRMEMTAVIEGLKQIGPEPSEIQITTDSEYVGKGISYWLRSWSKTGHKQKNADLWKILEVLLSPHRVYINYVKGHTGHPENEECDRLAAEARKGYKACR